MPAPDGAPNGQAVAPVITNDGAPLVREQDRLMPIANVIRIMHRVLPTHAKISDDAKETIQECVSEYISFITSEANDRCQREQRKTITAEDVLWAMSKLGFDDYIEPLGIYLQRFRDTEGDNRGANRGESLISMRPRTPAADSVGMYPHMVQNPPPFHAPVPPMAHLGMFGDGMGGYYAGMYSGGGSSSSGGGVADGDNSGQAPMPNFDGYAPYK